MRVSGERTGAMVTMNRLSVEDPDDDSPLLPEAAEASATTIIFTTAEPRHSFLSRYVSAGTIHVQLL